MPEGLLDYTTVLKEAGALPALLLGNGFSIAYSKAFSYSELRQLAELPPALSKGFDDLETADFEEFLRWFRTTQRILTNFGLLSTIEDELRTYESTLRQGLIESLTAAHPESFATLEPQDRDCAIQFLEPYGKVFTLCYDLLLYWLKVQMNKYDAFRKSDGGAYRWDPTLACEVSWLHGGFHLYEQGKDTYKIVSQRGKPGALLATIVSNMEVGVVPMIVAEGTAEQKRVAIARNDYLAAALERLSLTEEPIVTFGASFHQDAHIVDAIVRGRTKRLFIGVQSTEAKRQFENDKRYANLAARRTELREINKLSPLPLQVEFWDTSPYIVWGRRPLQATRS